ncbi:hypothetical protein ACWZJV_20940 [Nocardioides sp. WG-D5]
MSIIEDLRHGALSDDFVRLLYKHVATVAKARNFPPPEGYQRWTADAVVETAHDFLADDATPRRLVELVARAEDDDGFARMFGAAVRNFLRDRGRKTVLGKLVRRLRPLLRDDVRFEFVPDGAPGEGNVYLAGSGQTAPSAAHPSVLQDAARSATGITVVRWSPDAKREGPLADTTSLLRLSEAVLSAAEGSLRVEDLADVLALRLGVDPRRIPATTLVDDWDPVIGGDEASVGMARPEEGLSTEQAELVDGLLAQLSDKEVLVLAWLHEKVRVIADQTGLAVSSAGLVKQRVTDKLSTMLSGIDMAEAERTAVAARDEARKRLGLDPA